MRGGRFMSVEDIIFLMRKDKVRLLVQTEIVQLQKISILPQRFFVLHPPPCRKFHFSFPLGISNALPSGGYRFFLELHIEEMSPFSLLIRITFIFFA